MTTAQPQFSTRSDEFVTGGLPLREFWGNLADVVPRFGESTKYVDLPFTDLEVIEAEPGVAWPHPIAQLECYAAFDNAGRPRQFGAWWILVSSAEGLGYPDFMSLKGQRLRLKGFPTVYEGREQCVGSNEQPVEGHCPACGKDMEGMATHKEMRQGKEWRVMEVAGQGGAAGNVDGKSDEEALLSLLSEPKNAGAFAQAVLAQPSLRAKYGHQALFDGDVLAGLVASGKVRIQEDEETYERV